MLSRREKFAMTTGSNLSRSVIRKQQKPVGAATSAKTLGQRSGAGFEVGEVAHPSGTLDAIVLLRGSHPYLLPTHTEPSIHHGGVCIPHSDTNHPTTSR